MIADSSLLPSAVNRCLFVIDDIWDERTWNLVEGIFKDSAGSKIITTTRNHKIAEGVGGAVYTMKPLSREDSEMLLRTKAKAESHDTEFNIVAHKIFDKFGGVPIAITMIGSFLAKKKRKEWHKVYNSIRFDEHKKDAAFKHVMKVFSYSYYALPYNIKKCFLYLSLFPENHWMEKNMLIWRWIAEGLVPDGLFETGETYFNELLDMSMIQWAASPRDLSQLLDMSKIKWAASPRDLSQGGCRIHSLMLDLIRDLSSSEKENFSTVLNMRQKSKSLTGPIHRLAIHQRIDKVISIEVGEVLSFCASTCPSTSSSLPALHNFANLRVMDLESCDLSVDDWKLKHLRKLKGLKYVGLVGTPIDELPAEIGDLELLQTLDVMATRIRKLPPFVGQLTRMMGRVGELTSLEELWLYSADKSPDFATELQKLTNLRVLVIRFDEVDEGMHKVLVVSLHKLKKLQVPELSKLLLKVDTLKVQHLEILGQMPSLHSLSPSTFTVRRTSTGCHTPPAGMSSRCWNTSTPT